MGLVSAESRVSAQRERCEADAPNATLETFSVSNVALGAFETAEPGAAGGSPSPRADDGDGSGHG